MKKLATLTVFLFALVFPIAAQSKVYTRSAVVMGTEVEVTVSATEEKDADKALAIALEELKRVEGLMSEWDESSPVGKINREAGKRPVEVNDEVFKVVSAALEVSKITGGAFDITWAAMRGLWDFRANRVPSLAEIKKRLPLVNYRDVILDPQKKTVFLKRQGMAIGLGGIAKGYGVDKAMEALARAGFKDAILKAGGDMRVQGTDNGKPWEVGIKHPREKDKIFAKLRLSNISISTSGDYERFFIKDGTRYHHIIDPRTGYPAKGCRSVTILAGDTMTTDALSTAIFVMGPARGLKLVEALGGVETVIIDAKGKTHTSGGMQPTAE